MDAWRDILSGLKNVYGEKPCDDPMDFNKVPPIKPALLAPADLRPKGRQ